MDLAILRIALAQALASGLTGGLDDFGQRIYDRQERCYRCRSRRRANPQPI